MRATSGAASTTTSVTAPASSSPKPGSAVELHETPYTVVSGKVAFAPVTAGSTKFYLRRDGCGTSNDNPHTS